MPLTLPEVERIAQLARLEIGKEEAEIARRQLNDILGLIEAMQAVDTAGIEPMSHAVDVVQRLRADAVTHRDADGKLRDLYQAGAPEAEAGLYLVPRVVE
ncbi:MAG: Asp-tRNA(Asn)/Glu-tRNA(Gln) amidotransferase subunit GatC [Zoogloeaceae bacterium]|jgi:aspartyl-tRNA(Asn)/glutamyl-tRNA(Gln) amidotransferase subunit C|nr:Asp-tRNA(Asn)/Glu-tRNA(Gln) amidotransferase subunit GatC [Zoogloeaceae bacterium]